VDWPVSHLSLDGSRAAQMLKRHNNDVMIQVCLDADANAVKNQFLAPLDLGKNKAKPQFDVDQIDFNRKVLHRYVSSIGPLTAASGCSGC
jgi:hypothetical protein